jgi:hypothetical protein
MISRYANIYSIHDKWYLIKFENDGCILVFDTMPIPNLIACFSGHLNMEIGVIHMAKNNYGVLYLNDTII